MHKAYIDLVSPDAEGQSYELTFAHLPRIGEHVTIYPDPDDAATWWTVQVISVMHSPISRRANQRATTDGEPSVRLTGARVR